MPKDPTIRSALLRLPAMRRSDAPSLGRTKQQVRRNVPRLRRLLTPKIRRRRQPTEALMIMITEECHAEEMQAFATRRPAGCLRSRGRFETWAGHNGKSLFPISPPNRQKPFANVRRFPPFLKTTDPRFVVRNSRHGKEKTSSAQMARNHTRCRDLHSLQS